MHELSLLADESEDVPLPEDCDWDEPPVPDKLDELELQEPLDDDDRLGDPLLCDDELYPLELLLDDEDKLMELLELLRYALLLDDRDELEEETHGPSAMTMSIVIVCDVPAGPSTETSNPYMPAVPVPSYAKTRIR